MLIYNPIYPRRLFSTQGLTDNVVYCKNIGQIFPDKSHPYKIMQDLTRIDIASWKRHHTLVKQSVNNNK